MRPNVASVDSLYQKAALNEATGCMAWKGYINNKSYPIMRLHGKHVLVSRLIMGLVVGYAVPKNLCVIHSCDNPKCINPSHLRIGTQRDNIKDMIRKGRGKNQRITHCPKGHEYTKENTKVNGSSRVCITCRSLYNNMRRVGA